MQADVVLKEPLPMGAPLSLSGGARVWGGASPLVRHCNVIVFLPFESPGY